MQPRQAQESNAGFYLVLASLLFEFGRPQSLHSRPQAYSIRHRTRCVAPSECGHVGEAEFLTTPDEAVDSFVRRDGNSCSHCKKQLLGSDDFQGHAAVFRTLSWYRDVREFSGKNADAYEGVDGYPVFLGGDGDIQRREGYRRLDGG